MEDSIGNTTELGWPSFLEFYIKEEEWFFQVEKVLELLGLMKYTKKNGYTAIDKFLCEHGMFFSFKSSRSEPTM
jgi:lipopolysaccharide biosynthesis protein